ncbi:MAG: hypothetical protein V7782_09750 [Psychromonas sp.]
MKSKLKNISEVIAEANDVFNASNQSIDTIIGILDKALRKQGMNADAVTIDCIPLNKKIVFLLHDDKENIVDVAFGNKAGDIHSSAEYELSKVTVAAVVAFMDEAFVVPSML